ncbi:tryptophan 2,3-dioxygenase [Thermobifida halotolerans]|uniref:hypothetical protein n=1 Tax=Thermobifida halotolerans TaxID=483545 RepID=UPI000A067164|nr:hypothetical protein [Thermobifida halotolerans]
MKEHSLTAPGRLPDPAGQAWPPHVGVGGVSLRGARTAPHGHSPARALNRVAEWADALDDPATPSGTARDFPFGEVLEHYQALGRAHASPELVSCLRALYRRLPPARSAEEAVLADWLPSTFDQHDGDYDSYLAAPMLERLAAAEGPEEVDTVLDVELLALLADLARTEGEALAESADSRRQRQRTHAALQALTHWPELAPRARLRLAGLSLPPPVPRDDPSLASVTLDRAWKILDETPELVRRAAEASLLPTTPLHDEVMFIRSVQLFEIVYRQVLRCLERAAALSVRDTATAGAELGDAVRRVESTPSLFRVLTTMSRESFAVIRAYTDGRSAIQSRAYRLVERTGAPRPPGPFSDRIPKVEVTGPTVQEAYVSCAAAVDGTALRHVAEAMARLDRGWRAMKRTHWGITLKIIGNVTGTGGTPGADYLRTTAAIPLFPLLHEPQERSGAHAEEASDV